MQIVPIKDLKDTARISALCHEAGEPVFVTKNGYQDLVIMSAEVYDEIVHQDDHLISEVIAARLESADSASWRPAREVLSELRSKHGL